MTEERRQTDSLFLTIIDRLASLESTVASTQELNSKLYSLNESLIKRHDLELYGEKGDNGLKTTVAKVVQSIATAKWLFGGILMLILAEVVSKYFQ